MRIGPLPMTSAFLPGSAGASFSASTVPDPAPAAVEGYVL